MRSLIIKGRIESISGSQSVDLRSGGTAQVADAIIRDDTGSIKLSLWDNQINSIKEGDIVIIEKGYTKDYRGEIILMGSVTKC